MTEDWHAMCSITNHEKYKLTGVDAFGKRMQITDYVL
jgi:hypothetical protein